MNTDSLAMSLATEIANAVRPLITDMAEIGQLAAVTLDKGGGHTAHELDRRAEDVLFRTLTRFGYQGAVYSEEAGYVRLGDEPRLIVCDPYCNTTITFRGIRESAVAVYEYTLPGQFVSGAIADLQIPRVVWSDARPGAFVTHLEQAGDTAHGSEAATWQSQTSAVTDLTSAFLVVSLLKRNRRAELPVTLVRDTGMLATIDGAIVAARIAAGEIDGFVDARIGQPSYEALAYMIAVRAGGVVTDEHGVPIDFGQIARGLAAGKVARHTLIVAANRALHEEILRAISS